MNPYISGSGVGDDAGGSSFFMTLAMTMIVSNDSDGDLQADAIAADLSCWLLYCLRSWCLLTG